MDNNALLLLAGAKKIKQTIGVAGQQGFGVGVYGGDSSDLTTMGLAPMSGCHNPSSDNYGNYMHANGSVMVFVPAFAYRLGNAQAPSYKRDGANALEIRDAAAFPAFEPGTTFTSADLGDGWILPRAFVDGGVIQRGFFFDKYMCSNNGAGVAVSVKNADWLMCDSGSASYKTNSISGMLGQAYDAITLSRARGEHYSLVTIFQWAAMAALSLAHGQAATSAQYCAWYDAKHSTNFPKGATNSGGNDYNDSSIAYSAHAYGSEFAKTGSSNYPAKCSHNGQLCGIMDIAGMANQWTIGGYNKDSAKVSLLKNSVKAHSITGVASSVQNTTDYTTYYTRYRDGSKGFYGLQNDTSGMKWDGFGIIPTSASFNNLFGSDEYYEYYLDQTGFKCGLGYAWGPNAGVWCRSFRGYGYNGYGGWGASWQYFGFRASGYAP